MLVDSTAAAAIPHDPGAPLPVLLRGRSVSAAREALADLSARFLRLRPSALPDYSLADGLSGVALAHAALDDVFPRAGHRARAERLLLRAIERLSTDHVDPGLHLGLAGVGWSALQLIGRDDRADHEALLAPIDRALADVVDDATWSTRFDLVYGIAGIGVYALERLPDPSARLLLDSIVMRLAQTAREQDRGVAWWTDPAWSSCAPGTARPPGQDFNLGVAHGSAGVIALLGNILVADVAERTRRMARQLLRRAVEFQLARELAAGFAVYADGSEPARVGWCVGDLGIAAALLVAARGEGERSWERAALRAGLRAAARATDGSGVVDGGLCHGAAGIAHAFHRLYRETGDDCFAAASRRWFTTLLGQRKPRGGFAGFRALDPDRDHKLAWQSPAGLLTGAAGITLALVAATTDADPSWDRALLLS